MNGLKEFSSRWFLVLIETYWNVNTDRLLLSPQSLLVLIETYWNVNLNHLLYNLHHRTSINRNILECKCPS